MQKNLMSGSVFFSCPASEKWICFTFRKVRPENVRFFYFFRKISSKNPCILCFSGGMRHAAKGYVTCRKGVCAMSQMGMRHVARGYVTCRKGSGDMLQGGPCEITGAK